MPENFRFCQFCVDPVLVTPSQQLKYILNTFTVHGSVHLGNEYVQLKVQLDVLFICILYSSLFLALHVSGAICTHPQEHKLQSTTIGICNGYGMLIHWSTPSHF
jgi:hypothetical protein